MNILLTTLLAVTAILLPFSTVAPAYAQACDPNYEGACIQPYEQGDVNCGDITERNFQSVGSDPHRLDGDKDGIACEKR